MFQRTTVASLAVMLLFSSDIVSAEEKEKPGPALRQLQGPEIAQMIVSDTSERRVQGRKIFSADALNDGRLWSSWGSDKASTWIEVRFPTARYITRVQLMPAYADAQNGIKNRRRVKEVTIVWDKGETKRTVEDSNALVNLNFPQAMVTSKLRIVIDTTYGRASDPLAIGELMLFEPKDIFALKPKLREQIQAHIADLSRPVERQYAIEQLTAIGSPAITWLLLALADDDPIVQEGAVHVLHKTETSIAIDPVADAAMRLAERTNGWTKSSNVAFMKMALLYLGEQHATRGALLGLHLYKNPNWRQKLGGSVVQCLASTGHPDALEALEDAMQQDSKLALAAMPGFASLGEPGLRALAKLAADPSAEVRLNTAQATRFWKDDAIMPTLHKLSRDAHPPVRAQALYSVGLNHVGKGLKLLVQGAKDPEASVRLAAAKGLAQYTEPEVMGLLAAFASDKDPRVRLAAVHALETARTPAALPPLIALLSNSTDPHVSQEAERALQRLGSTLADVLVPMLGQEMVTDDRAYSQRIAYLLANSGPAGVEKLLLTMEEDNTRQIFYAQRALEARPEVALQPIVRRLAQNDHATINPRLLTRYISIIARSDDQKSAAPILMDLLDDPRGRIRSATTRALGFFDDPHVHEALIKGLDDGLDDVRKEAAIGVGQLQVDKAVPLLIALIEREDAAMIRAIWALGKIRDERAIDVLHNALTHERSTVRQYACDALGSIGKTESQTLLLDLLADEDELVRYQAMRAFNRID